MASGGWLAFRQDPPYTEEELKFWDTELNDSAMINGDLVLGPSLNLIPQNATESGRIGRACWIRHLSYRYSLRVQPLTDTTPQPSTQVRLILYFDCQANGAAATTEDILESASDTLSYRNRANLGRFQILMDRNYIIGYKSGGGGTAANTYCGDGIIGEFSKEMSFPVYFSSTTGAISEVQSNNLGILYIADGSGTTCRIQSLARVLFSG